ncbi:DUF1642 domain-containing protein [Candidatus Enterococcus clewellii]|uniref:DUF1642 domain-containing protein n=1 Tax=Candidatus Enterococcus clewellii TaxID=1834193 RepID=A0A242K7X7_9ENTE|nr:DUF1642 domain-containing protein [Enterococcus sp. 9E7_DIV0242]OTP17274.1 hypothetical protein A5888_001412 [Enterococcus sp. 9E7_DIV0242]
MSKVDENIGKYKAKFENCMSYIKGKRACMASKIPEIKREAELLKEVIDDFEEIRVGQEETRLSITDTLDVIDDSVKYNNLQKSFKSACNKSADEVLDEVIKYGPPSVLQAEQEELQKKADKFDELSDAEWDEDDVILIMTEFHDEYLVDSENSVEISIKYAHKIIELFQVGVAAEIKRQNKPVKLPGFIVATMKNYDSLQYMLTEEYYSDCDSSEEIFDDSVYCWIADNFDLLCRAWITGNYTTKQEPKYMVIFIESEDDRQILFRKGKEYEVDFESNNEGYWEQHFTEKEIKALNKNVWSLAEEIEEETK